MNTRINYFQTAPDLLKSVVALDGSASKGLLPDRLVHLVRLRGSQINGCAYCLRLHAEEARADKYEQNVLDVLSAWRESQNFSDSERAALAWAESLTEIASRGAPDSEYDRLREFFDERSSIQLTLLIGVMNVWNRLALGFGSRPDK